MSSSPPLFVGYKLEVKAGESSFRCLVLRSIAHIIRLYSSSLITECEVYLVPLSSLYIENVIKLKSIPCVFMPHPLLLINPFLDRMLFDAWKNLSAILLQNLSLIVDHLVVNTKYCLLEAYNFPTKCWCFVAEAATGPLLPKLVLCVCCYCYVLLLCVLMLLPSVVVAAAR
ncbi:hypothetical protein Dimus_039006 [Dionaea muscipula]